jgi:hypothetical protein
MLLAVMSSATSMANLKSARGSQRWFGAETTFLGSKERTQQPRQVLGRFPGE